jgi:hypothetical protein
VCHIGRRIHAFTPHRRASSQICGTCDEEDTCVSYGEEDTCLDTRQQGIEPDLRLVRRRPVYVGPEISVCVGKRLCA